MLQPKKTKYRKTQKGRMKGFSKLTDNLPPDVNQIEKFIKKILK